MLKISTLIISVFMLCFIHTCESYEISDALVHAGVVREEAAREICKKHGVRFLGSRGQGHHTIRGLTLDFEVRRPLTKPEARFIAVDAARILLKKANENEGIRPYLIRYPFTLKEIYIGIFSEPEEEEMSYYPWLCTATVLLGKVGFFTNGKDQEYGYKTKEYETFEEALAILRKEGKIE